MSSSALIDRLIQQVGELPPMTEVAQKALQLLEDPETPMGSLASVISLDEAMASLVLRWSNSAYYGLKFPASTVQQAVVLLGQRTVHSLILSASLASLLSRPAPGYGLERGDLWRHSIGVAAGARMITLRFGDQVAEEAYHAGLLCDIGKLAMEVLLRNEDASSPAWQERSFLDAENARFGLDHAEVGAEMARRWRFSPQLVDAIACHHRPAQAGRGALLASAVHVADAALMMLGIGIGKDGLRYELDPTACARLDWNETRFNDLLELVIPFIEGADAFIRTRR